MNPSRSDLFEFGVVHGRFQIFHLSHLKYLLAAKEKCETLIVGITNPERSGDSQGAVDENRFASESNPFSYFERAFMIRECLLAEGLKCKEFQIVPFPIEDPARIAHYVPETAKHFLTIYDDWGRQKLDRLRQIWLDVEVLCEKTTAEKIHVASEIRNLISKNLPWTDHVPDAIYECIQSKGWINRF